ncbi:hypothetical protein CEP52_000297 [Fusarium oligoseptatum]|uniref:Uncharacterized protein n=1 Tax=Fusarium oligoseptatum TaxID=2604345 RepID=A0A428UQT2_9HYPO|nr:hypothetical protein CEP52_000297 [Fusarium oligoseptatum]
MEVSIGGVDGASNNSISPRQSAWTKARLGPPGCQMLLVNPGPSFAGAASRVNGAKMPEAESTPILRPRSVDSQVSGASTSKMLPQAELRRAITEGNGIINAVLYDIMASMFERPSQ